MGLCSTTCSHSNTASLSRDIEPEYDVLGTKLRRFFPEKCGDGVGLIVTNLEDDPTVGDDAPNCCCQPSGGATNAEIARSLHLTQTTVKTHLTRIYGKLGIRSRTQLAIVLGTGGRVTPR